MSFTSSLGKKFGKGASDVASSAGQQFVEQQITNQFQQPAQGRNPYSTQTNYQPNPYSQERIERPKEKSRKEPGGLEYIIWGIVLIVYDIVDTVISLFSAGTWEFIEWIPNLVLEALLYMRGIDRKFVAIGALEFIPLVDYLPIYAIEGVIMIFKGLSGGDREKKGSQKINISLKDPKMRRGIVLVLILFAIVFFFVGSAERTQSTGQYIRDFFNGGYVIAAQKLNSGIEGMFGSIANFAQDRYDIATGQKQVGIADLDAGRKLGVEAEWIDNTPTTFQSNQQIALVGLLSGNKLSEIVCAAIEEDCSDRDDIEVTCSTTKGELGELRIGRDAPSSEVVLSFEDLRSNSASVECNFGSILEEGGIHQGELKANELVSREVILRAKYPQITGAHYNVPALTSERYLENVEKGITYDLSDAKTSQGPVRVEFIPYKTPFRVSESGSIYNSNIFGFNIENVEKGTIDSIDAIVVQLPEGADYLSCGGDFVCNDQKCSFPQEALSRMKNIATGQSIGISCTTYINPEVLDARNPDVQKITFNVLVKSTYTTFDKELITIRNDRGIEQIPCGSVCESAQCACSDECPSGIGFVNKGQSCGVVNS